MESDTQLEEGNYFVQKNRYKNRAMKFLMVSGGAMIATLGVAVASPALGALAIPVAAGAALASASSIMGFTANKVAENLTDVYEDKTMRQRFSSGLKAMREKTLGASSENKLKMKA
ncbi:hypothetical protein B9Z45_02195 [Limnohabitans sp. 2KL-17]|uniref:hypothetical protein n=1 Tax=Limnohabitans sp. 2KL-17 TaxID=1100704 RepID=UPI000D3CCDE9|nr:hypothetical protein [Limnohabitans sp. 2KL-17]PUE62897.1 hypothetical protein B9Z45_02195 [Limnohabitans sp. 2KL-17]